jgi:hypothetical protein
VTSSWRGPVAAVFWFLLCLRWFDVAAPWRPRWLAAVPASLIGLALAASLAALLARHGGDVFRMPAGGSARDMWLAIALALALRLPLVWTSAVGYTTPDGSLSGIVAWRAHEGTAHLVFVPSVPYSGSLKSHLTAALLPIVELQRAFALSSVLFYAAFVGVIYALAASAAAPPLWAAMYVVLAPAFVTHYSLSNDGNYVEVLALGTFALLLAVRSPRETSRVRDVLAWAAGVALGLAFWCHILAVMHALAAAIAFVASGPRRAWRTVPRLAAGFVLGYLPGVLWNAANGWESLRYLLPGGPSVGTLARGPSLGGRVTGMVRDQWPVLLGYDPGYGPAVDALLLAFSLLALATVLMAVAVAVSRGITRRDFPRATLLLFTAVNLGMAAVALPYIEGNPRYLLFLVAPIAVFLADALGTGRRRLVLAALIAAGGLSAIGQWRGSAGADARWRGFVRDLEAAGVTHCYADFYIAAKIDMVSEERVICASDSTEYFHDYRDHVAEAPRAALIAVNPTAADKLMRRLDRLGVSYQRLDLMKPVLLPERNVAPEELFAGRPSPEPRSGDMGTR